MGAGVPFDCDEGCACVQGRSVVNVHARGCLDVRVRTHTRSEWPRASGPERRETSTRGAFTRARVAPE